MAYPQDVIDALDKQYKFTLREKMFFRQCGLDETQFEPSNYYRKMLTAALMVQGMEAIIHDGALAASDLLIVSGTNKDVAVLSVSFVEQLVSAYDAIKDSTAFKEGRITLKDMFVISGRAGRQAMQVLSESFASQVAANPAKLEQIKQLLVSHDIDVVLSAIDAASPTFVDKLGSKIDTPRPGLR